MCCYILYPWQCAAVAAHQLAIRPVFKNPSLVNVVITTLTNESQVHELAMPILYSHWWGAGLSSIIDTTNGLQMRTSSAATLQSVCHLKAFLLYVFLAFKSKI